MTSTSESHTTGPGVAEARLAADLGVKRGLLERVRGELLREGEDFGRMAGRGIVYTEAGVRKVMDSLPRSELEKNGAPPVEAVPVFTVIVVRPQNVRTALVVVEGRAEPHRAFVRVSASRLGARTLTRGVRLEGCTQINDELFDYAGPVPLRPGQPVPKKEGARP